MAVPPMSQNLMSALVPVYGDVSQTLEGQAARIARGLDLFATRFGHGSVTVYRSPGRVNLIGEHTDYNHGYVLPMALDRDVLIFARSRSDDRIRLPNVESAFGERSFRIAAEIPHQSVGDWANYVQGPAQLLEQEYGPGLCGFDAVVDGAPPAGVPRGAGLSSSSALTVAAAVTLVGVNGIEIGPTVLADACGRAEWYVGTRGGIMDQFIAILARRGHALFLDCRPCGDGPNYHFRNVPIPEGYAIVMVDSSVRHSNTGPLFNRRVAEGRIGVRLLQRRYPSITHLRDVADLPWSDLEPLLPEQASSAELNQKQIDPETLLDGGVSPETDSFRVRQRCRHVVTENARVLGAVSALEDGDMDAFGQLMGEAHASARDDYEISTPEIEVLVRLAQGIPGTVGVRLTGAGWGGCIVAVVEQGFLADWGDRIVRSYRAETALEAQAFVCRSAAGAGPVWTTNI